MTISKWSLISLALLLSLSMGIAAAQDDHPYPVITPDNVAQMHEVQHLGDSAVIPGAAWSPDGTRLLMGGYGGFWLYPSLGQAPVFYPLSGTAAAMTFVFAPQGDLLFLGDRHEIVAYDLTPNSVRYTLEGIRLLAFSHSGDWLAYEVDDGVHIGRVDSGETVYDLSYVGMRQWPDESDHQKNVVTFGRFLPDDSGLVVRWETYYSATWEGRMYWGYDIWSLAGDQPTATAAEDLYRFVPEYPDLLSVLPDGQIFAIKEGTVVTEGGSVMLSPSASQIDYDGRAFSLQDWAIALPYHPPDDSGVTTAEEVVGVWDVRTGELIGQVTATGALALNPDSSRIVINTTVYDVATGEVVARLQNDNYRILPGTDRILLLKSDDTVHLLDTANLEDIATLEVTRSEITVGGNLTHSYLMSPETHTILFPTQINKRLVRIDLDDGDTLAVFETSGEPIMYTPDNRYLITGVRSNRQGSLALWDVTSGQPVDLPPETQIALPILSPNGLLVLWHSEAVPGANEVMLYDIDSATPVMTFPVEPIEERTASPAPEIIRFSPGDAYLVIDNSEQVVVWDWRSGEMVLTPDGASYPALSPDERLLAYQSNRGQSVEVISVPEGTLIWQTNLDYMIGTPGFVADTILRIEPLWEEVGDSACYDVVTGLQSECPMPEPIPTYLETDNMRFFVSGTVTDLTGEALADLALPQYAVRLALSSDRTRLWIEYYDGTLGLWAVVPD